MENLFAKGKDQEQEFEVLGGLCAEGRYRYGDLVTHNTPMTLF